MWLKKPRFYVGNYINPGNSIMLGRRVKADKDGYLKGLDQPGDYGRVERTPEQVLYCLDQLYWQVITPDGSKCKLDPVTHTVIEHQNKTISVYPSIVSSSWHGWLVEGVWKKAQEDSK